MGLFQMQLHCCAGLLTQFSTLTKVNQLQCLESKHSFCKLGVFWILFVFKPYVSSITITSLRHFIKDLDVVWEKFCGCIYRRDLGHFTN